MPYLKGNNMNKGSVWFTFTKINDRVKQKIEQLPSLWVGAVNHNLNTSPLTQFHSAPVYYSVNDILTFKEHLVKNIPTLLTSTYYLNNSLLQLNDAIVDESASQSGGLRPPFKATSKLESQSSFYYNLSKASSGLSVFFRKRTNSKLKKFRLLSRNVKHLRAVKLLSLHQTIYLFNRIFKSRFRSKRPFLYTNYPLTKDFITSKSVRKLIPDLPVALRGAFLKNSAPFTFTHLSESFENTSTYELNRSQNVRSYLDRRPLSTHKLKLLPKTKLGLKPKKLNLKHRKRSYRLINLPLTKPATTKSVPKHTHKHLNKRTSAKSLKRTSPERTRKQLKRVSAPKKMQKNEREYSFNLRRRYKSSLKRLRRLKTTLKRKLKRLLRRYFYKKRSTIYAQRRRKSQSAWFKQLLNRALLKEKPYWLSRGVLQPLRRRYSYKRLNVIKWSKQNAEITVLAKQANLTFGKFAARNWKNYLTIANQLHLSYPKQPQHVLTLLPVSSHQPLKVKIPSSTLLTTINLSAPLLFQVWSSAFLLKYVLMNKHLIWSSASTPNFLKVSDILQNQLKSYFFSEKAGALEKLNTWNVPRVNYTLRKKLLRVSNINAFATSVNHLYYHTLTRFVENCTGRKVAFYLGPFVNETLTFEDRAFCSVWAGRVKGFQRILGHKIFAVEALDIVASALRLKDPTFLANWIRAMLKRMSFWKFRLLFRYLKFLLMHLFRQRFEHFMFKGFKLRLKGKISVAGNARTRALHLRVGDTSHTTMSNRIAYDLSYVGTFTGVLGLKLWFFF